MSVHTQQQDDVHSPFHAGEREVQTRAGVRQEAEKRGQRMLTRQLNDQQRQFFPQLPFLLSAHIDDDGQPWAGLITGQPGFISTEDHSNDCTLHWHSAHNPTQVQVQPGDALGLLGIELSTRRRNRLNTTVTCSDSGQWRLSINQGYGNCPKYINARPWPDALFTGPYTLTEQEGLSASAAHLATNTDTFFIATSSGPTTPDGETQASAWGADVSHRGGDAGFLQWQNGRLKFEDYPGNNMFNTLGNIAQHPHCGLLIVDFANGDIVQLAAQAEIVHYPGGREVFLTIKTPDTGSPRVTGQRNSTDMLNMDFTEKVVIDTASQDWVASPMPGVWRKPLAREDAERGHATSIVRYEPGARFSPHDHPKGEEILVLEGVFSDDSGNYPAGTYFRNPEGFRHAPFSEEGCVLLVKLHQFQQDDTEHVVIDTHSAPFQPGFGNLQVLSLHQHQSEQVALVRWPAGEQFQPHSHFGGEEIYVISGELKDEHGRYPAGTWIRSPHLSEHLPFVEEDTLIWVKVGHLPTGHR